MLALAAVLGLLGAEWVSVHHKVAAALCFDHVDGAPSAAPTPGDDDPWERGLGDTSRLFAFDGLASGELPHELCHLCRSSRERFAADTTRGAPASFLAESTISAVDYRADIAGRAAIYALAPKTSPPA